jgi:hypothetical protein
MTSKKKDKYRTRNWKEYNRSLVNRGSITFWFEEYGLNTIELPSSNSSSPPMFCFLQNRLRPGFGTGHEAKRSVRQETSPGCPNFPLVKIIHLSAT